MTTQDGEPEVETDFEEIKKEAAEQHQADREAGAGGPAASPETSIADTDYLPREPGPAATPEDYDPFDVDPEDVDDK